MVHPHDCKHERTERRRGYRRNGNCIVQEVCCDCLFVVKNVRLADVGDAELRTLPVMFDRRKAVEGHDGAGDGLFGK